MATKDKTDGWGSLNGCQRSEAFKGSFIPVYSLARPAQPFSSVASPTVTTCDRPDSLSHRRQRSWRRKRSGRSIFFHLRKGCHRSAVEGSLQGRKAAHLFGGLTRCGHLCAFSGFGCGPLGSPRHALLPAIPAHGGGSCDRGAWSAPHSPQ